MDHCISVAKMFHLQGQNTRGQQLERDGHLIARYPCFIPPGTVTILSMVVVIFLVMGICLNVGILW